MILLPVPKGTAPEAHPSNTTQSIIPMGPSLLQMLQTLTFLLCRHPFSKLSKTRFLFLELSFNVTNYKKPFRSSLFTYAQPSHPSFKVFLYPAASLIPVFTIYVFFSFAYSFFYIDSFHRSGSTFIYLPLFTRH